MKTLDLGKSGLVVPNIGIGCMRISELSKKQLSDFINTNIELGLNFFDHADIYGAGECESKFGVALGEENIQRDRIILQSKCSIVPGKMYDCSKEYIMGSVDSILKRLNTDYLDVLLLHRPDALIEPEEVADAFSKLYESGKVRRFGVSNMKTMQIKLLKKYVTFPIIANQLQLSMTNCNMISNGINVNTEFEKAIDRDDSILDYCRLEDITIQTWSPFQYGFFEGTFLGNSKFADLNKVIDDMANKYQVSNSAIAIAWILRHPAKMQAIIGTTNLDRISEIAKASSIEISREDWYALYKAAGNDLP